MKVVLGTIVYNQNGQYCIDGLNSSLELTEPGLTTVPMGAFRVLAAGQLASKNDCHVLALSDFGTAHESTSSKPVSIAEATAQHLKDLGVPTEKILIDKRSLNTVGELALCLEYALAYSLKELTIVTNSYHIPRITSMLEILPALYFRLNENFMSKERLTEIWSKFIESGCKIYFRSAENILLDCARYSQHIPEARQQTNYSDQIKKELAGTKSLNAENTYYGRSLKNSDTEFTNEVYGDSDTQKIFMEYIAYTLVSIINNRLELLQFFEKLTF